GIRDFHVTGVQTCALPISLLDLEHLGDLPGMRLHRTCDDVAAIGRLELACLATGVVEEGEREHDAALLVDGHEAAVTDAVHESQDRKSDVEGKCIYRTGRR